MILTVPDRLTTWESVALVQIAQAAKKVAACEGVAGYNEFTHAAGIEGYYFNAGYPVNFADAYRKVEQSKMYYGNVLAQCSGLHGLKLEYPVFPTQPTQSRGVVLAPVALKPELNIQVPVWRAVVKHLRSYGEPVYLMGDNQNERMDAAAFPECDMFLSCTLEQKLQVLANAKLVVGTPNAWMWIAAGMTKTLVIYPDSIPQDRWWPWNGERHGRLLYQSNMLQIPVLLAGLRKLISNL